MSPFFWVDFQRRFLCATELSVSRDETVWDLDRQHAVGDGSCTDVKPRASGGFVLFDCLRRRTRPRDVRLRHRRRRRRVNGAVRIYVKVRGRRGKSHAICKSGIINMKKIPYTIKRDGRVALDWNEKRKKNPVMLRTLVAWDFLSIYSYGVLLAPGKHVLYAHNVHPLFLRINRATYVYRDWRSRNPCARLRKNIHMYTYIFFLSNTTRMVYIVIKR